MEEITVPAKKKELDKILSFFHQVLEEKECDQKIKFNLDLVVEEIFVNVSNYSYPNKEGVLTVKCDIDNDTNTFIMEFIDSGVKFNPLKVGDPDLNLNEKERQVGGLGIFLAKKLTDEIFYSHEDNKNHLFIKKKL
ncbi:MAG: ATP-binding protein [Oscillospiraceae bacterium]|jgi:anti-sigma regulatory factor (Ser/Thr protein kinase)|nr:ATP-binding protein [Oscillospiraceae bacterium]